jgi:hypothetical protein
MKKSAPLSLLSQQHRSRELVGRMTVNNGSNQMEENGQKLLEDTRPEFIQTD